MIYLSCARGVARRMQGVPCEVVRVRVSCRDPMSLAARPPVLAEKDAKFMLAYFRDAVKHIKKYFDEEGVAVILHFPELEDFESSLEKVLNLYNDNIWSSFNPSLLPGKDRSVFEFKYENKHDFSPSYDVVLYAFLKCLYDQKKKARSFHNADESSIKKLKKNLKSCIKMLKEALKTSNYEVPDRSKAEYILNGWTSMPWSSNKWPDTRADDPMDVSSRLCRPTEPMELGHHFLPRY